MSRAATSRIMIAGASGTGKSSYVKQLIRSFDRVVIFDPMDEYHRIGAQRCKTISEVQAAMRRNFRKFLIAFVPRSGLEDIDLNRLSNLCLGAQQPFHHLESAPVLTLVVEEMNLSFPVHKGAEANAPAFANICSRGRHYWIGVIGVTQRLAEVSTRFRGNIDQSVIFRQAIEPDQKAARTTSGASLDQIAALEDLDYLHSARGKITQGRITF